MAPETEQKNGQSIVTSACWFRCDLRLEDNPALDAACQNEARVAFFVISPEQWTLHDEARTKILFWREALRDLIPRLERLGIVMKFLRVDHWSDLAPALLSFCQTHGIDQVHCNREQGVNERKRDRDAYTLLKSRAIALVGHDGQTLLPPGSLKTGAGDYYRVFTPFAKAAAAKLLESGQRCLPTPKARPQSNDLVSDSVDQYWPSIEGETAAAIRILEQWPADHESVMSRFNRFFAHRIEQYHTLRDIPGVDGTSTLSPYLAAGLVSPRQCLEAALHLNSGEINSGNPGVSSWINELLWREFYRHLLLGFPKLSMHRPLRDQTDQVVWRDAPKDFEAWCQGKTGIPIVDAAMKQLVQTGWMHNRLRMIVAMFLSKNLLVDWRLGEAFFMRHLIDGDLAANNGGWQWSASTGADSAPYFRVFNPVSQSQKFDPQGKFLRQWLPELSSLDNKSIHNPSAEQRHGANYPQPIEDLKSSRLRAIAAFENL